MKRILNLLVLLMVMTSSTSAAENISLSVSDMQFDWGGWGGRYEFYKPKLKFK